MKDSYHKELFTTFKDHHGWRQEIECFTRLVGGACWILIPLEEQRKIPLLKAPRLKAATLAAYRNLIIKLLEKTIKEPLSPHGAHCANNKYVYILPILRGNQVYGYLALYHLACQLTDQQLQIFNAFTCSVIENIQKEKELSKLYETIRPKTIALSTVHTIGRILSATLEIDELLPRIARLSLQVLRARRCSIMLLDKSKRKLIPHAVVDLKQKSVSQNPLKVGYGIAGKTVKTGKIIIQPRHLCVPLVSEENIIGTILISYRIDNKPFGVFDKEILTTLSEQAVIAIKNAQLYEEQEKLTLNTIKALASVLSSGAAYNYGRSNLFINITMSIGMELKLRSDQMRILYYASILHNVSQMGLPEKILKKSTRLTGKDHKIIRQHPRIGAQIIQPIGGRLKAVLPIIICHHERYDGTGYPSGLKGDQIPLGARILAVADAFEAMLSQRPYRKKKTLAQAVSEIVGLSGEQFDPVIVDAFVRVVKRYRNKIFRNEKQKEWIWKKF